MRSCWLCGRTDTALDHHHIYGGANRAKSEKYGLVVDLCHDSCHIFGRYAAHQCRETMQALREYGQRLAMREQGWTAEEFRREFGRNYLPDEPEAAAEFAPDGFEHTDLELCVNW